MAETVYNVEYNDGKKWWYVAQAWTKKQAISIARRHPNEKMRVRKVLKTVVWTKAGDNERDTEQKISSPSPIRENLDNHQE